jgi:LemA protein
MVFALLTMAVVAVIAVTMTFNRVIDRKSQVQCARASIDAAFKQRHDLIPRLIVLCEKHLGYEAAVLKDLTMIRTKAIGAVSDRSDVHAELESQLRTVFAAAEQYPALREADSFVALQRSLAEVAERLAAARRTYHASVAAYDRACCTPITGIAARILGYRSGTMAERVSPTIAKAL